ncbi:acyl-CoA synthetase MbcS [Pseudogracilibacillus auburnensis]|uniref:acyl-CoA synthetase MbcS n=1 Tax=Pseudogracilibacillus auburnensis TaxID=1494959 RepID=UPI001A957450|nr:acyl--CoA ligase [Pseudogracilibacillus auburnensis]MBO1001477.1 acyl--CoA ligase [Pseudogracilibacillus auburnensis]
MDRDGLIAPDEYNIVMEIEKHAKEKEKIALVYMDEVGNSKEITYEKLLKNVNKIGNVFLEKGLQKGDKLLIMVPRILEAYEVYLAALKTGIIIIPSSEMLTTEDLQYRVTHGEVDGVVSYHTYTHVYEGIKEYETLKKFSIGQQVDNWYFLDELKEHASSELTIVEASKDDVAFLPYTSGTTGNPKGVVHTHGWGYAHLRTVAANWLGIGSEDKVWATAAPGWQKWVWSPFLSVLGSGATGFIYNGKFNPETYLTLLQNEKINVLCCTPTEYRMRAKLEKLANFDLSHLHSAVSAGEPLNREVIDTFQNYFSITVRDGYGQTENTLLLGIMKGMEVKPGSMGKPTPGNEVEVINDDGETVDIGEVGDIAVKINCPALFENYYKDDERTKKSFRGEYYITGDRAKKDEDGYFWFEGRDDDIIVSSGYTIGPFEVEDVLVKHPAVQECAVVGSPDDIRGQIVKAFIVLREGKAQDEEVLMEELQNYTKAHTAPYKYPRKIEFMDELPKTSSGKIRRVELRQLELERNK